MKLSKNFFKNFLFSEMPLYEAAILVYEQKHKIFEIPPTAIFDLHVISFICTNFEASTNFTRIHCTIKLRSEDKIDIISEPSGDDLHQLFPVNHHETSNTTF